MGRMLGSFADEEELDRPDLNKCPDCGCFFGGLNCPICGKVCPEEMRAGNRKKVKRKKRRNLGSGRVTFISWYHSWWFIVLMMFMAPVVGIVLLITSPHKTWKKVMFAVLAAVYMFVSTIGVGYLGDLIFGIGEWIDKPVNDYISMDEYVDRCSIVEAKEIYRSPSAFKNEYVCVDLVVIKKTDYAFGQSRTFDDTYYVCTPADGSGYIIILRDCLVNGEKNLMVGDYITVYGEVSKYTVTCYFENDVNGEYEGPCVNMAYVDIIE